MDYNYSTGVPNRPYFSTLFEHCGADYCDVFNGRPFTVIQYVTEPTDDFEAAALPMYIIEIDGVQLTAFPEEVEIQ